LGSRKLRGIEDTPEPSISFGNLQAPIPRTMTGNALSCQTNLRFRRGLSSCKTRQKVEFCTIDNIWLYLGLTQEQVIVLAPQLVSGQALRIGHPFLSDESSTDTVVFILWTDGITFIKRVPTVLKIRSKEALQAMAALNHATNIISMMG